MNEPERAAQAGVALREANALLQQRAQKIQDTAFREQFLANVPFNRDVAMTWRKKGQQI